MKFGTTYSHRHASYLKLDPEESLNDLIDFGFSSVRLACYWEEIESQPGAYNYSAIKKLLNRCEDAGLEVVLTLGMKAPRWPEYYFPKWLKQKNPEDAFAMCCRFIEQSINELQTYTCITHWQVENEPLDPSGKDDLAISRELLEKEIALVRDRDSRPIIVNLWANELKKRNHLSKVEEIADVIGFDIYYKVPLIGPLYKGPDESDADFKAIINALKKPVYITELQAEPWENNILVSKAKTPKSMNEKILKDNLNRVVQMNPERVYFWGFEYWLWQKMKGNDSLWLSAKESIAEYK